MPPTLKAKSLDRPLTDELCVSRDSELRRNLLRSLHTNKAATAHTGGLALAITILVGPHIHIVLGILRVAIYGHPRLESLRGNSNAEGNRVL